MSRKEFAIYHRDNCALEGGKFVLTVTRHLVRVMVRAEGYAMVRNPGCIPFVVSEKKLTAPTTDAAPAAPTE